MVAVSKTTAKSESERIDDRVVYRERNSPATRLDQQLRNSFLAAVESEVVVRRSGFHRRSVHVANVGRRDVLVRCENEVAEVYVGICRGSYDVRDCREPARRQLAEPQLDGCFLDSGVDRVDCVVRKRRARALGKPGRLRGNRGGALLLERARVRTHTSASARKCRSRSFGWSER